MWSMRGHGENWRLKRGSFRDMVCWEEEVGSQSRSGGDVMMLRFIVHMFEVQLWRLQHLEVEKPGCGVRGGLGGVGGGNHPGGCRRKTEQAAVMGRAHFPRRLHELLHPGCSHSNTTGARTWVWVKSLVWFGFFPKHSNHFGKGHPFTLMLEPGLSSCSCGIFLPSS